ncbi:uncharacterized protein LY89DRAFT_771821 [Mollisia scopiformis]|uniref:Uncharacterized protein n=1 Tax=Mollisia scopiformis TaxID=149040 RepID=A0A194XKT3_MOLSC|nr:uncharacterized protein LY89DRAFT_771821 [Mollisia scopiformis]KUJ20788.1 hypothetical protein LY89DRAFT_771821 [Mollisia scopiformis]
MSKCPKCGRSMESRYPTYKPPAESHRPSSGSSHPSGSSRPSGSHAQRPGSSANTLLSSGKSLFKSQKDVSMSKLQTKRSRMPDDSRQAKEQDVWANTQLAQNGASACPVGLLWSRDRDGYRCIGGGHFVSDQQVADGKGGWYYGGADKHGIMVQWYGPFYEKDPFSSRMSEEKLRMVRKVHFGSENPTAEDKIWTKSLPRPSDSELSRKMASLGITDVDSYRKHVLKKLHGFNKLLGSNGVVRLNGFPGSGALDRFFDPHH